jgi:PAS domain S-box-containing protein
VNELAEMRQRIAELEASETERKLTDEALRESEERLRSLFETMAEGVILIAPDGQIVQANHAAERILGLKRSEIEARNYVAPEWEILRPDGTPMPPEEMAGPRAMKEKRLVKDVVMGVKRPDGSIAWINVSAAPLINEAGRFEGVVGTFADITERKRAEERVLRQSAVLAAINEVFQETLTCETDEEVARTCLAVAETLTGSQFGFISELNPAGRVDVIALSDPGWEACRMPKTDAVLLLKDMEIRGLWGKVLKDEQALIVNDPAAHPDRVGTPEGHPPLTCFLGVPLKQAGRTIGMIALANKESGYDLADQEAVEALSVAFVEALMRKRAEEELAEERNLLRTLIDNLPDYIYAKDTESRFVLGNIAAAREVGVTTPDKMLGKTDFDFFPEELAARYYADEQVIFRSGLPLVNREEPAIDHAGNRLWVLTTKVPLRDSQGQIVGLVGMNRDITERKQRAEEIRQRTAQLEALRQVGLEITAQLDLDALLRSIVSRAMALVGGTSGGLYLYRPERDVLEWAMAVGPNQPPIGTILHRSEGLSGKVWKTGEPLIVDDYQQWAGRAAIYEGYPWTTVMAVPVRWGKGFLGVLNVLADPPHTFSPADAELLSLFANQAAIAIANARLFEQAQQEIAERKQAEEALRRRAEELAALQATVLEITAPHDLPTLLRTVVERAALLLNVPGGGLYLCHPDRGEVRCVVSYNTPRDYTGTVLKYGEGAAGTVAQTGEPLIIDNYRTWNRRAAAYEEEQPFTAVLSAPMIWQSQVTGVIHVLDDVESRRFTKADLELLTLFADHAAIAVENARLFEEIEERRLYLEGVLGATPDAIVTLDARHRIVEWNPGAERLFGYSREEVIGRDLDHLITSPGVFEEAVGFTQIVMSGKEVPPVETVRYRKDGSPVDVIVAGSPILVGDELIGVVAVYTNITERKRVEEELQHTTENLRKALGATIQAIALTVETKDPYTAGHQRRVADLARVIATEMGLAEKQIDGIRMAGVIHDIGKIYVPGEILSRPGRISDIEFSLIKTHPQVGYDILKTIDFPWPVAQIVLQHHERMDGSGYPQGLSGEEIMLEARIMAVADVVEAMASHRPYRPAHGIEEALDEVLQNGGVLYDPEVVDACLKLFAVKGFKFE